MLERLIGLSIRHRWLTLVLTAALVALGVWSYRHLSIDATPDITNVQVQINTQAPGYSPLEAEQRVTFAIETAMAGLPKLDYSRSLSRYGLSQVTVVFKDGTDLYFARQQVAERLQQIASQLPEGLDPEMVPGKEDGRAIAATITVAAPSVDLDLVHAVTARVLADQFGIDQVMLCFNDPGPVPPPPTAAPLKKM